MYPVLEGLRLNEFKSVSLPTPRQYAERFGFRQTNLQYSDDNVCPMRERKLDSITAIDRLNQQQLAEEAAQAAAAPASPTDSAEPTS